jgi:hypothetical protein
MKKLNLSTLVRNAARAKRRLLIQEARVKTLAEQIISRVGTGGQTFNTELGQVIVTAETIDRNGPGFNIIFNRDKFLELDPKLQLELTKAGVVETQKQIIRGCAPRVQFRLVETS